MALILPVTYATFLAPFQGRCASQRSGCARPTSYSAFLAALQPIVGRCDPLLEREPALLVGHQLSAAQAS